MNIGFTFDLRENYLARGFDEEAAAEFDRPETIDAISTVLTDLGHSVDRIGDITQLVTRLARADRWDLVFNIAEGLYGFGREAQVPALLDAYQIPYTFSDPLTLSLTLHKGMAKRVVRDCGISTAPFTVVEKVADLKKVALRFPLFAKPVAEGSSKGIGGLSKVENAQQLQEICTRLLTQHRQPVLVETYLPGREFTVGIIGSGKEAKVLAVMEVLLLPGAEQGIYSLHNKEYYENLVDYRLVDGAVAEAVRKVALKAWRCLGCRDAGRIDIRLDADEEPHFIEVNPLAGLNPVRSDLAIMAKLAGIAYADIIKSILQSAMQRVSA